MNEHCRERDGDRLIVYQKGKAKRGPLTFAFENVREIHLVPYREIRSRLISGDLKTSEFTTRIVDEGGVLHIVNSGRYTPKISVPPLIGPALIEADAQAVRRDTGGNPASEHPAGGGLAVAAACGYSELTVRLPRSSSH